jgi:hypothetical protein
MIGGNNVTEAMKGNCTGIQNTTPGSGLAVKIISEEIFGNPNVTALRLLPTDSPSFVLLGFIQTSNLPKSLFVHRPLLLSVSLYQFGSSFRFLFCDGCSLLFVFNASMLPLFADNIYSSQAESTHKSFL